MRRYAIAIMLTPPSAIFLTFAMVLFCGLGRPTSVNGPHQRLDFWVRDFNYRIDSPWQGRLTRGFGWTQMTMFNVRNRLPHYVDQVDFVPKWVGAPTTDTCDNCALSALCVGWPWRCFRARLEGTVDYSWVPESEEWPPAFDKQRATWDEWQSALIINSDSGDPSEHHILPCDVMPRGLVSNLLFWCLPGLVYILVRLGIDISRAIARRQRGGCRRCGYPIGVSKVCTECGATVTLTASWANEQTNTPADASDS